MATKKIQVVAQNDDGSKSNLWSLLEGHGFSVMAAPDRNALRYNRHPHREISPSVSAEDGTGSGVDTTLQDLYEGTVKLEVMSDQHIRKMVNFVRQLRLNPGFRLLLMEANQTKDAVSIMLGLREPTALGPELMAMDDVFSVEASPEPSAGSGEPVLLVTLV